MKNLLLLILRTVATWKLKNNDNIYCIYRKCEKWCSLQALLSVPNAKYRDVLYTFAKLRVWDTIPKINVIGFINKFSQ